MGYYEKYNPIANALNIIGYPTTDPGRAGSGWQQQFTGGTRGPNILMRADRQTQAHDVYGSIMSRYLALGGPRGTLGFPTTDEYSCNGSDVCQQFMGGRLMAPPPPPPPFYVHHVYGTCADGGCGLREHTGPGYSSYPSVGMVYDGQEIDIVCQTTGELVTPNHGTASNVWDRLTTDAYVTDVYVDTSGVGGSFSPPIPHC
jgi:hypothetical protein